MSYDVHISRRQEWSDVGNDITLEEWKKYCESDSDMELLGEASVMTSNGVNVSYVNDGLAIWKAYPNGNNLKVWFDYRNGKISVKNPDSEIINKMILIAHKLNGKVQGDEGEYYE
jgi:hypothetical protein